MKIKTIAILAAMMVGCSTTPVSQYSADQIPAKRIHQPSYIGPALKETDATIVFLRDAGFYGSACSHSVHIDNVKLFTIRPSEGVTVHVPAGRHFIRLESGGGMCPNIAASQETVINAGDRQIYRILLPSDGSLRLTRME